ncbi:MAG: hypothetical protein ACK559_25480, partial [bacterium]
AIPLSVASMADGVAGAAVSSVKAKLAAGEALPATSAWRTRTVFAPSDGVKVEDQLVPPSVEYCTAAPVSMPERLSAPALVM